MNKLEVGMIFKNAKELSIFMNFKDCRHTDRILKRLSRFCEYHRYNRSIIIDNVFEHPLEYKELTRDYIYDIESIVHINSGDIKILKQIKIVDNRGYKHKGYLCKCLNDQYVYKQYESLIKNKCGCPVCTNKIIIKGINDIATTHPDIIKYFVDINDAYENSYGSHKKVWFHCPDCLSKKKLSIYSVISNGFSCPKCSDGVSYPNKFVFNFLEQISENINIDFYPEKSFKWSDGKIYDEYIQNYNILIENHGLNHYEGMFTTLGGKTYEEELLNDNYKMELANKNGFYDNNYIILDCRYSKLEWIKNSIMTSKLPNILNFNENDIDWFKCHEVACNSRIKDIADMWNDGYSKYEISGRFKICTDSVVVYLKKASVANLCEYDIENERIKSTNDRARNQYKPIYCINTNQYFDCIKTACHLLNLNDSEVGRVASGKRKSTHGFTFKRITKQEFNNIKSQSPELAYGDYFILPEETTQQ